MTTVRASAAVRPDRRGDTWTRLAFGAILPLATAVSILALTLVVLLQPMYVHRALDAAGAPAMVGVTTEQAHALSDRTVAELLAGPGTFAFAGPDGRPFYDPAEAAHLRDVRLVLLAFLAVGGVSLLVVLAALARGWRSVPVSKAVARGGAGLALTLIALGAFAFLAFDLAFELFHRLLFPGGNWAFDPTTQRLVQLYPLAFWQLTAGAMGVLGVSGGVLVWLIARRRAHRLEGAR